MRLSFIAALLSVGFFAGCGGVEQEAQEAEVTAMRPPPCEYACDLAYNACMRSASTQAQKDACAAERIDCYGMCFE